MRIGIMIGPERGRYASKVERLRRDARWAEEAGLSTIWVPQIPDEFDALTAAAVIGAATERIEIGTAVVPIQMRHPVALAQQAISVQAVCDGRLRLGIGVSHHWIVDEMFGMPYERLAGTLLDQLDVLEPALVGTGPIDVENDSYRVHMSLDVTDVGTTPVLLAALGPRMLQIAGERSDGTILWMADERTIETHVAPRIRAAAESAGRPRPRIVAGIPMCVCDASDVDRAIERANRLLSEAEVSPNYQRLLEHGEARAVGDLLAAGTEEMVARRLQSFADAGATDASIRIVPIGDTRDELIASRERTRAYLASLGGALGSSTS